MSAPGVNRSVSKPVAWSLLAARSRRVSWCSNRLKFMADLLDGRGPPAASVPGRPPAQRFGLIAGASLSPATGGPTSSEAAVRGVASTLPALKQFVTKYTGD